MKSTVRLLRVLLLLSIVMTFMGVVNLITAEHGASDGTAALLMSGTFGSGACAAMLSLHKRVSELENRRNDPKSETSPQEKQSYGPIRS